LLLFPNGCFRLWDLDTWKESAVQYFGQTNIVAACVFSGGRGVALGDTNGGVKLWDLSARTWTEAVNGFDQTPVARLNCSADGSTVVGQSAAPLHLIKAWNAKTGQELCHFAWTNHFVWERLPISPDGRCIVTATEKGETDFWTIPTLEKRSLPPNEKLFVTSVAFERRLISEVVSKPASLNPAKAGAGLGRARRIARHSGCFS
jgi:WD40 repeat protein